MEQALLLLPMDAAVRIIKFCPHLLEKKHDSKTLLDIYTFLLMIHHSAIMQNMELYEPMEKFTKLIGIQVKKEMVSYSNQIKKRIVTNCCSFFCRI